MSPVSNISPLKSAFFAAALLGLVALGLAIRGAAQVDVPLGAIDDYGNRHQVTAESRLTTADDYGTRNQAAPVKLTTADDFGTRHITKATQLGPNDDYWTRQSR